LQGTASRWRRLNETAIAHVLDGWADELLAENNEG
jgi:hypothetical protein